MSAHLSKSLPLKTRWPKRVPVLTPEQERVREDFVNRWLDHLPRHYGWLERFNHRYPLRALRLLARRPLRTLDIGAGQGEHLGFEPLDGQEYVALEYRHELAAAIVERYPAARVIRADCQGGIPAPDRSYDRVVAVHVLEHLPDLPRALDEIRRILRPDGVLSVVIPCEGGFAYGLARHFSARRLFWKYYKQDYDWFVAAEHVNRPHEILDELRQRFTIEHQRYFPLLVASVHLNLVVGLTLRPLNCVDRS